MEPILIFVGALLFIATWILLYYVAIYPKTKNGEIQHFMDEEEAEREAVNKIIQVYLDDRVQISVGQPAGGFHFLSTPEHTS